MNTENQSWTKLLPPVLRERLHGRMQLQRILSNIVWLSLDKLVRLGLGAIVGVWMARYLGPQQFGLLNYAIAFVALFSPLGSFGIESILVRDVLIESESDRRVSLGTAFAMRSLGSLTGASLACLLILVLRPAEPLVFALVIIAGAGMVFQSFDVIDLWFHSQIKAKLGVYPKNAAFLLLTLLRVYLLLTRAPLVAFAIAATTEVVFGAAGLVFMYRRQGGRMLRWKASLSRAVRFLKDSWPLAFANLTVIFYIRIGQVMLGNILNDREVGIYSVAARLAEMWYFIPMSIATSVFPSVIKAKREGAAIYKHRLEMFYGVMGMISLGVALITFLFANTIITLLFGPQFSEAGPVLSVYIWASIPVFLNIASTQYLIAENRAMVSLARTVVGSLINVLLNYLLIPRYGTVGVAYAALVAYCVTMVSITAVPDLRGQMVMMLRSLNPWWVVKVFRSGG